MCIWHGGFVRLPTRAHLPPQTAWELLAKHSLHKRRIQRFPSGRGWLRDKPRAEDGTIVGVRDVRGVPDLVVRSSVPMDEGGLEVAEAEP